MVFDTSLIHDAVNDSDETRYILMMRIWHPDLTEIERHALQHTFDCLNVPNLVSDDPSQRLAAEKQVEAMHTFPKIQQTSVSPAGFGSGGNTKNAKTKAKGKSSKAAKGLRN